MGRITNYFLIIKLGTTLQATSLFPASGPFRRRPAAQACQRRSAPHRTETSFSKSRFHPLGTSAELFCSASMIPYDPLSAVRIQPDIDKKLLIGRVEVRLYRIASC